MHEREIADASDQLERALQNPVVIPGMEIEAFDPISGYTLAEIVEYLCNLSSPEADAVLRHHGLYQESGEERDE